MAPREALEDLNSAARRRVPHRFCAPVFHAATVPSPVPHGTLAGLARGAASGASMAGAGAAGEGLPCVYTERAMSPDVA